MIPKFDYICAWDYADVTKTTPKIKTFPLSNIDEMRMDILADIKGTQPFIIDSNSAAPYRLALAKYGQKSVLVFLQDLNDTTTAECIKLSDIERCKTVNQGRDVNGIGKVIDKLQLVMYPYGHKGEIVLEFYNAEVSMQLHDELLIIEKWAKKINAHLS